MSTRLPVCFAAAAIVATALAGCADAPPPAALAATAGKPAAAAGKVLGRSERFLVVEPGADDSLRTIAERFLGSADRDWQIADFNGIDHAQPGQPLVVPLRNSNAAGVFAERGRTSYQTVPILCYHRFGNDVGKGTRMAVSPASFAQQLDWLSHNGYRVIRLSQLVGYLQAREPLPRRAVVITIDDGYESTYRLALPLLRQHGFPATLFVYTDFIGARDALSWAQLQALSASGLVDVQAHSKSHHNLAERFAGETDGQYQKRLEVEASVPRQLLEHRLQAPVQQFAFPYGDANESVLQVLARQQYQLGLTVTPGGNAFFAQPLMLHRTMIFGDHDLDDFKARLQVSRTVAIP